MGRGKRLLAIFIALVINYMTVWAYICVDDNKWNDQAFMFFGAILMVAYAFFAFKFYKGIIESQDSRIINKMIAYKVLLIGLLLTPIATFVLTVASIL